MGKPDSPAAGMRMSRIGTGNRLKVRARVAPPRRPPPERKPNDTTVSAWQRLAVSLNLP